MTAVAVRVFNGKFVKVLFGLGSFLFEDQSKFVELSDKCPKEKNFRGRLMETVPSSCTRDRL